MMPPSYQPQEVATQIVPVMFSTVTQTVTEMNERINVIVSTVKHPIYVTSTVMSIVTQGIEHERIVQKTCPKTGKTPCQCEQRARVQVISGGDYGSSSSSTSDDSMYGAGNASDSMKQSSGGDYNAIDN